MTSDNERAIEALNKLRDLRDGITLSAADLMGEDYNVVLKALQRDDSVVEEMAVALDKAICSHRNLYVAHFGEGADPMNDLIYRDMQASLSKFNASRGKK